MAADYIASVNDNDYSGSEIDVVVSQGNTSVDEEIIPNPEGLDTVPVHGFSVDTNSLDSTGGDVTVTVENYDWTEADGYFKVYYLVTNLSNDVKVAAVSKKKPSFIITLPENTTSESITYGIKVNDSSNMVNLASKKVTVAAGSVSGGDDTPTVDQTKLKMHVVDTEGNAVAGLKFTITDPGNYSFGTAGQLTTDDNGDIENSVAVMSLDPGTSVLKVDSNSNYVLDKDVTLEFAKTSGYYSDKLVSVNNQPYEGLITVVVKKKGESSTPDQSAVDRSKFVVKAVDAEGKPVQGVKLALKGSWSNYDAGTTGANGEATIKVNSSWYGNFTVTTVENSGYQVAGDPSTINIGAGSTQDEYGNYINELKTVNGKDYDGSVIEITVETAVVEPDPEVQSVTCDPMKIGEEGGTVTVKVSGVKLPDTMYYKVYCNADDSYGDYYDYSIESVGVTASGSAEEKTFTVDIPAISTLSYSDIQGFKVGVSLNGIYAYDHMKSELITIESATPSVDKAALNSAISEADSLSSAEYTSSTWTAFAEALATAKTVQGNADASQSEVTAAVEALATAKEALVSNRILNIKVVDENGNPVILAENELWIEKDSFGEDYYFAETDENGMISLDVQKQIIEDTYTFMLDKEGYELAGETVMTIDTCSSCYDRPSMIGTVNGKEYTGLVTITAKKSEEAVVEPDIKSVEVNVDTAERQNQEVTVTVRGTALPVDLHYDIWSKTSTNVESPIVSDTAVTAEGTETERTFTVTLPDADKYDDVKFWRVRVAIDPEDGYVAKEIAVKEHVHDYVTVPGKAATCTESGLTDGKKCSTCGEVETEQTVIEALGHHEVVDAAKAPTYFATGLTKGKHCDRCGKVTVKRTTVAKLKLGQAKAPKLKAGKRYIKVSYQAVKGANAYQISYHKKGTKLTKTVTVKGSKAATKKLSKLSKKRWYSIKVRAIRTENGRTAYGSWSAARNAKVK